MIFRIKVFLQNSYSYNKYFRDRVCIVAPSRWLAETARRSKLLMNYEIHCISNGLDINIFKPRNRLKSQKITWHTRRYTSSLICS